MRNFKPDRVNEGEFVPGVDKGVKEWLKVRQAGRDAKLKGSSSSIITCDIKYKLHKYWRNEFAQRVQESINPAHERKDDSTVSLEQFESMFARRCSYEDILTCAMEKRNLAFIQLAIKKGIHINYKIGHLRRTMLHIACFEGQIDVVQYLLSMKADVNARDIHGSTPLHLAVQTPSVFHPLEIVELLLERNCKVNYQDRHGRTALHLACIIGCCDIIQLLLEYHAHPYTLDNKKKLAIDHTRGVSTLLLFAATVFILIVHNLRFAILLPVHSHLGHESQFHGDT
jgi:ankyrin repeat protein